jgi:transcriptional regulator GlxA family with amidase domain
VRRILIVANPPAQELDVIGPLSVFSTANEMLRARGSDAEPYAPELVTAGSSLVVNSETGFSILAVCRYADVRGPVDTLLIAGGPGARTGCTPEFLAWLKRRAKTLRRIGSVCTGAFILADAGLLDGHRVATHWLYAAELAARHPEVEVDAEPIYVQDGKVFTSAGITAGMDLALAMVEEDHGSDVALAVARHLVMFLRRPGGQAQFSVTLAGQASERVEFRELSLWITQHLRDDLRIEALAERAGMSDRNFTRMFAREVGMSPGQFVERARLERARQRLETSTATIDDIADRCGYGSREVLRRAFVRHVGLAPSEYRERFRSNRRPKAARAKARA